MSMMLDEQAVQRGKAARATAPRSSHARVGTRRRIARTRSRSSQAQAATRIPRLVPLRHVRMLDVAVHVLPRRRGDHGRRPRRRRRSAGCARSSAATRTWRTSAASRRRIARSSSTSTTSTRRCRARGSGTSSGSPPASPWRGRDRGFGAARRATRRRGHVRAYRRGDARVRRACARSTSGTRAVEVEPAVRALVTAPHGRRRGRLDKTLAKARAKDSLRAFAKLTHDVDGEPRIVSDPPLIVPVEELAPGRGAARSRRGSRELVDAYAQTLPDDRRRAARRLPARALRPQGRRRRQRRRRGLDRAADRAATTAIRSSCRSRRLAPPCSSRSRARARTRTPAGGSSRASG